MDEESVLLVACIPRLRRYARALAGNPSAAADLVQDTMERAWRIAMLVYEQLEQG